MLGARGPDLLSVDDVVIVALAPRGRAQGKRVGARCRLGDAEGLQAKFAAGDQRQIALFLRVAAVTQDCAHGVHLRMAGGAVAAGSMYLLQNCGSGADAESAAAILLGNERGEVAGLGERSNEFGRIGALAVERAPVFARKLGAERAHAGADIGEFFGSALRFMMLRYSSLDAHASPACRRTAYAEQPRGDKPGHDKIRSDPN